MNVFRQTRHSNLSRFYLTVCAVILFVGSSIYTGCNYESGTSAVEPLRRTPPTPDVSSIAETNTEFAFELLNELSQDHPGNLFVSPISISASMGMVFAGAKGESADQIEETMHFHLPSEQLHAAFGALLSDLNNQEQNRGYELRVVNSFWGRESENFNRDFLNSLSTDYHSPMHLVDFGNNAEAVRNEINDWVETETNGHIRDILGPGSLSSDTALVLTNAIYFKGMWAEQFKESRTRDEEFSLDPENTVTVPMMRQSGEYRFVQNDDLKMIELPYQGEDVSMLILLPHNVDGLNEVASNLTATQFNALREQLETEELDLLLPRFEMHCSYELAPVLAAMGMEQVFHANADLTGFSNNPDLMLGQVVHKSFIIVNEEGTEAAAATAVVGVDSEVAAEPLVFRADHPFLFVIRDNHSESVLFMGCVQNPVQP